MIQTFLNGVPAWTRDAFCPSFNEFRLSLDCPFDIDLSVKKNLIKLVELINDFSDRD